MVLVEAAMCGKPLISCEIGTGTSFVNVHGETGLVVEPEDPVALAQSRQRYERLFSGERLGRSYAALFEEVAERSRGSMKRGKS